MNNAEHNERFIREQLELYPTLKMCFQSPLCCRLVSCLANTSNITMNEGKDPRKDQFADSLKDYARTLSGSNRIKLYQEASDFIKSLHGDKKLNTPKIVTWNYTLKDSFLGSEEIKFEILKCLHTPKTDTELAYYFRCNRQPIENHKNEFRDGFNVCGMKIKTDFENGGKMKSTVHPVLLPLTLTEIYSLIKVLKQANIDDVGQNNPHCYIADVVADEIYSQLSDYAKETVDKLAQNTNFSFNINHEPTFNPDDEQSENHWAYLEKRGGYVQVTLNGGETKIQGQMMASSYPGEFLIIEDKTHDVISLRWDEIDFIEKVK